MFATVGMKFDRLTSMMNEKLRRRWAACEAMAMGYGGVAAVSRETGISRTTIRKGIVEIERQMPKLAQSLDEQRVRMQGGGRHRLTSADATLWPDLEKLLESSTRGDPQSPLQWTCKSVRRLADELVAQASEGRLQFAGQSQEGGVDQSSGS